MATTGDILRLWELVDNPHYGSNSNSINGRKSPIFFSQRLIKKAELVNVSLKRIVLLYDLLFIYYFVIVL